MPDFDGLKHGDFLAGAVLPWFLALSPERVQAEYRSHPIPVDAEDQRLVALVLDAVNAGKWIESLSPRDRKAVKGRLLAREHALHIAGVAGPTRRFAKPGESKDKTPAGWAAQQAHSKAKQAGLDERAAWEAAAAAAQALAPGKRNQYTLPPRLDGAESSNGSVMVRGSCKAAKMGLTDSPNLLMSRAALSRDPWARVLEYVACHKEHGRIIRCSTLDCAGWLHVPKDGPGPPLTKCSGCR